MNALTLIAPAGVIAYTLNLLLHLTVICLVVLCASRWFFRRDPAVRHSLCLTGLICLLFAPIVVGIEAKVGRGLITLALPTAASPEPIVPGQDLVLSPAEKSYRVAITATLPTRPSIGWSGWTMFSAYLLGLGWGALRFAHGCRKASLLKQDLAPWREPTESVTLRNVEQALRAPAPPVFTSPHVASPIAIGLLHPAVILPQGLSETLSPQQLRHVLLHECAHVAFRHGFGGLLERIAGVLFWPHPLVRTLCRELARAREEVCDNFASQEDGATCYARTLLTIAQGIDIAPNLASTLALLGTGTSLEARIAGLLDPRRNRMVSIKRWKLWAVTGTAIFAIASTAAVRVVAAQDAGQNPGGAHPNDNAMTRVFAFQFMNANLAEATLRGSLPVQQLQQINMAVNSRTNSMIVQCSGEQMASVATLLGRLEMLAEQARQKQEPITAPASPAEPIVRRVAGTITPPTAPPTRFSSATQPIQNTTQRSLVTAQNKAVQAVKSRAATTARLSIHNRIASTAIGTTFGFTTTISGKGSTPGTLNLYTTTQANPKVSNMKTSDVNVKAVPLGTTTRITNDVIITNGKVSSGKVASVTSKTPVNVSVLYRVDLTKSKEVLDKSLSTWKVNLDGAPVNSSSLPSAAQARKIYDESIKRAALGNKVLLDYTADKLRIDGLVTKLDKVTQFDILTADKIKQEKRALALKGQQDALVQRIDLLSKTDTNLDAAKLKAEARDKLEIEQADKALQEALYRRVIEQKKKRPTSP